MSLRSLFQFLVCLGAMFHALQGTLRADSDWIRAGTFIAWPDSLRDVPTNPSLAPADISRAGGEVPAAGSMIATSFQTAELIAEEESEPLPGAAAAVCVQQAKYNTYGWEVLPQGLLYHSYLAGEKEPRIAAQWLWDYRQGLVWETALGGRGGLFRYGTFGADGEGFQLDLEGAALARVIPGEPSSPLYGTDYRVGFIGTWKFGPWRWKAGYSHLSSHIGDEYIQLHPGAVHRNYVRDSALVGCTYDVTPEFQVYGEAAYAFVTSGGAQPIELQFGMQYSPATGTGFRGAPFAAINGHLRQELNMGGSVNVEAGWAWRGEHSHHLFRAGFQHYNGSSMQWSFNTYECMNGLGIWYDF